MNEKLEQLDQEIEKTEKSCGGRSSKKSALSIRQRRLPGRSGRTGSVPVAVCWKVFCKSRNA